MKRVIAFTGHRIDRDDHSRADPQKLAALRQQDDAMLLVLDDLAPRVVGQDLALSPVTEIPQSAELAYLGLRDGVPIFVRLAQEGDQRPAMTMRKMIFKLMQVSSADVALYGGARSLVDWHARHRFCAGCGDETQLAKGGWQRNCCGCGAEHFPRVDPVAIVLVEHEGALLLGRGKGWSEGAYSALAGFIEPGESIEEGVLREVLEEVGLRLRDVTYVASQPWPFPSQLMIGCHAFADSRELKIDATELEDARWFTRAQIASAMQGDIVSAGFAAPPPFAIAHALLQDWLESDT